MPTDSKTTRGWDAAYLDNDDAQLWSQEPMPIVGQILTRAGQLGLRAGVDLGCGDGRNLLALRQGGLDLAGFDISPTALARADALLRSHGTAAPLIVGDVSDLPFPDSTLDLVTALDVAGQVPDPRPMLTEIRRCLHARGLLVVNLFTPEDDTYGAGEEVAPNTFLYKETLFRYFEDDEIPELFEDWEVEVEKVSWMDPPHGDFRPTAHRHVNHVVQATPA